MNSVAASAAAVGGAPVRRQRVRVPMRLVSSPHYQDVALSVYVKVKALASRPEGCQARTETIASYLGLSTASVERGMTQLRRPGPDGVVELVSDRRTLPCGTGTSAVRTVRAMARGEAFVWLPTAAAEDLTPRQLRVYALVAYAQARGIALTEAELASCLRHHSGKKAGEALSVTAASAVVDEVETARWMTVQRRAGARGRNVYIAHDLAPEARADAPADPRGDAAEAGEAAVDSGCAEAGSSQVGEGSGPPVGEGSLANKEAPMTDSPDDGRALLAPAEGEAQVGKAARPVENPAGGEDVTALGEGGLALRAGGRTQPSPSKPKNRSSRYGAAAPSYDGPRLAMNAQIYAVLEPVHVLLEPVNDFVARKVAREVGRQLREGTSPKRLQHRLTARLAKVMLSDIKDPGRWLLGVALPRWGCGLQDCETGVIWRTGAACEICAEVFQGKAAARQREQRLAQVQQRVPDGPPRGSCGDCGARIMLTGRALEDGLCKLCREEAADQAPAASGVTVEGICSGWDEDVPCGRAPLPSRSVCARHRVQELAGAVA
ncbi:hypothetical protein ABZ383_00480 [Streptomyces sp. NPDC005900]|uniref:hypothetical protein n=1 Tax=Streptomyces sp. NPDC005900 TaxID=3154569 RepID=UPI0033E95CA6